MVMDKVLGASGSYLLLMIVFMALMATGSGEIMAISSILVYDIYKTFIGPFRLLTVHCKDFYLKINKHVSTLGGIITFTILFDTFLQSLSYLFAINKI